MSPLHRNDRMAAVLAHKSPWPLGLLLYGKPYMVVTLSLQPRRNAHHPRSSFPCRYLQRRRDVQGPQFTYEIIVVDDGSKDGTARCEVGLGPRFGFAHAPLVQEFRWLMKE